MSFSNLVKNIYKAIPASFLPFLPYILLVLFFSALSFVFHGLNIFIDELGYWGQARYLAGGLPVNFLKEAFTNFGYSLFLVPIFLLRLSVLHTYLAVIFFNILAVTTVYLPIYYLLKNIFGLGRRPALIIALISNLYPTLIFWSNMVMVESVFSPLYIFWLMSFAFFYDNKKVVNLMIFMFLGIFLFVVHPRAWLIPWMSILYLLGLLMYREISRLKFFFAMVFSLAMVFLASIINRHLASVAWQNVVALNFFELIRSIFNAASLKLFLATIGGQLLYLIISTYGLFLVALFYLIKILFRSPGISLKNIFVNKTNSFIVLFMLSAFSIIATSWGITIFSSAKGLFRLDHIFYGRYNDSIMPFFVAIALTAFYLKKHTKIVFLAPFFLIAIPLARYISNISSNHSLDILSIGGLIPFLYLGESDNILLISIFGIGAFIIIQCVLRNNIRAGFILLAISFILSSMFSQRALYNMRDARSRSENSQMLNYLTQANNITAISFDMSNIKKNKRNGSSWYGSAYYYQYYLPKVRFYQFVPKDGVIPKYKYILSEEDWSQASKLGAVIIFKDNETEQVLWKIEP